ncbi:endonuclease domain-containing protein [Herbiconiux sp. A18JL235]|uniref:Endonuclease domain-containing protein n=1 Tax=Herbiconiux sp. A18JL235 TaxID=3152363 RepID=A0AB39BCG1_9MICO
MLLLDAVASLGGIASLGTLALEHGVSSRDVGNAVRRGEVTRVRQGWVCLPAADRELVGAVRVGGTLSCTSILRRHGIWCAHDRRLHVRVLPHVGRVRSPFDRKLPLSADHAVHVHRPAWPGVAARTCAADDLSTALALAVVCQPRFDAVASLDSALNRHLITQAQLDDVLAPLPAKYRAYAGVVDGAAQSGLETKARLALRGRGVRLRTQVRVPEVGRVDLLLGDRLVLELDGWEWHSRPADFEEDRRRSRALAAQGFRELRFSYRQVTRDWAECERVVLALVRADEHLWRARHVRPV